ncbi:hypothetical protein OESDEN_02535 [Oesophagostomum dentatum]|uniref:Uncharacterized protein n=1 Tax=Oesophagostomum dentatum TaxID=61180 RepID=A0A0B1TJQ1_OESDE|nr:hypothetical protein OESDEN_02535 [Oesophagostomum dentatum]
MEHLSILEKAQSRGSCKKKLLLNAKIIFSDEKKFNLDNPGGNRSYWRDLWKDPVYFSRRSFGGGSLMIIFLDEKKFNLDGPDGNRSYWRDLRKAPISFTRRNFGGRPLMMWGPSVVATNSISHSCRMYSEEYQNVLREHLLPILRGRRRQKYTF